MHLTINKRPALPLLEALLLLVGLLSVSSFSIGALDNPNRILVLGATGFVGQEIVAQLEKLGVDYRTASKTGRNCDYQIDLTAKAAADQVADMAAGCDAVISVVGSIGDAHDQVINAASGPAAVGAKQAGVKRFVFIGNDPAVRELISQNPLLPALQSYAAGKEQAEELIRREFPQEHYIIQPNFIYGGDDFSLSPPRVPSQLGQVAEDILGLYPLQAASRALPGVLGLVLGAPVSRERVAAAAVHAALGLCTGANTLSSREEIIQAASKRPKRPRRQGGDKENEVKVLKQAVYDLGDCQGGSECLNEAFDYLEQIETLATRKPAEDPLLNGRWDFSFDVEADLGTGVVKDILEGRSPIKAVFDLKDLYMVIENQSKIQIFVETKILGIPAEVVLRTTILPEKSDPTGTTFNERFEGIELAGMELPIPDSWRQSRPLEFTYLDDTMLIARGNGGEPHFLKRDAGPHRSEDSRSETKNTEYAKV